jgi:hypothetical protein
VADGAAAWASIIGVVGFLTGLGVGVARGLFFRGNGLALGVGGGITGAVAGGLTPLAVLASDGVFSPLVSSSIAWAVAGLLAGLLGYGSGRSRAVPRGEWQIVGAMRWGLAGAGCAAAAWAVGSSRSSISWALRSGLLSATSM